MKEEIPRLGEPLKIKPNYTIKDLKRELKRDLKDLYSVINSHIKSNKTGHR
jgi:hypothetical protein